MAMGVRLVTARPRGQRKRRTVEMVYEPIVIERVSPELQGGRYPVKCIVGDEVRVKACIYKDGQEALGAAVRYKPEKEHQWKEAFMRLVEPGLDRWETSFIPTRNTRYLYAIEAWVDPLATWLDRTLKKCQFDLEVPAELAEGLDLLERYSALLEAKDRERLLIGWRALRASRGISEEILRIITHPDFEAVKKVPYKGYVTHYAKTLELVVDRKKAEYGAWYEMFPRSQGRVQGKSGTFHDCIRRLPEIKRMGFDVIYLAPIHPIGLTHRKGRNNRLVAEAGDPGSPWAIGSREGGHKSIDPALGTMRDFENFVQTAADYGIEIAMDFAAQCSPDHPYVKRHPEWFRRLPDGTIRYAENPPKKYQDIYPLDFNSEDRQALWEEMLSIFLFWIKRGVKIFRVDNPHTKTFSFWEGVIRRIQDEHPEVIFLSEAFTRPPVMKLLAKAGFTQSYTYFTWRNTKAELRQYFEELLQGDMRDYFRGNLFTNTPDILHAYLQRGGRAAFKIRLVLAATLSSSYGIYSGFELCENIPLQEGSEEYMNSEKYELKVWDWDRPGNIKDFIARVNRIRSRNPALQQYRRLEFFHTCNDNILAYGKWDKTKSNIIVVVVNLDPYGVHEDLMHFPTWRFGLEDWQTFQMRDLLTGERYYWKGQHHYIRLDPSREPAHIFQLKK